MKSDRVRSSGRILGLMLYLAKKIPNLATDTVSVRLFLRVFLLLLNAWRIIRKRNFSLSALRQVLCLISIFRNAESTFGAGKNEFFLMMKSLLGLA